ncbi:MULTISPECIES: MFS transporter [Lactobacillus]|uniref:MFS transporter n=1 Tax=Lactobacillus xujianguonis TaxID=2495899 RepID=A0A437SW61_9LACO|nr:MULTISPECIES: MFS transporter [Lactobacillus]RVU71159.1 MFS transporter [Lactobacillus xujianguonis]RVU77506.1 MFS transporter [Lactobacillus xujianguonis]
MKANKNSFIFKISLLSIGLMSALAQAVSGVFPLMYKAFPNISKSAIEMLGTIPNFGMIAGLILGPFLIKLTSKKTTIMIGLIGTLICGTFPIYGHSYTLILISRLLYGVFNGFFGALAISIVADYYTGHERATMLGFENALGSIGSGVCSLVLGSLMAFGWHAAFSIYLLPIIAIVLFGLFVPNTKNDVVQETVTTTENNSSSKKAKVPKEVILIAAIQLIFFIILVPMSYKLPQLVVSEGIGTAGDASAVYALFTLVGIPVSMIYGWLHKKLGFGLYVVALISLIVGDIIIATTHSLPVLYIAGVINGFGFGTAVPFANNWVSDAANQNAIDIATTISMLTTNIGVFLSPIIMNAVSGGSPRLVMFIAAGGFAVLAILVAFIGVWKKKQQN